MWPPLKLKMLKWHAVSNITAHAVRSTGVWSRPLQLAAALQATCSKRHLPCRRPSGPCGFPTCFFAGQAARQAEANEALDHSLLAGETGGNRLKHCCNSPAGSHHIQRSRLSIAHASGVALLHRRAGTPQSTRCSGMKQCHAGGGRAALSLKRRRLQFLPETIAGGAS